MKYHEFSSKITFVIALVCLTCTVSGRKNIVGKARAKTHKLTHNAHKHIQANDLERRKKLPSERNSPKNYSSNKKIRNCLGFRPSCLIADKTDKILSIDNEKNFVDKVVELMKADDSDVLKNINEEEQPFFRKSLSRPFNFKHARNQSFLAESFKRDSLHFLAFNSTMPDIAPGYPSIPFDSMLSGVVTSNASTSSDEASQLNDADSVPSHDALAPSHDALAPFNDALAPSHDALRPSSNASQLNDADSVPSHDALAPSHDALAPFHDALATSHDALEPSSNASQLSHADSVPSHDALRPSLGERELKASRVCKPGPPLSSNKRLPNCLIIGDSIALSYSYSVAAALQGRCVVQIAPFSSMGVALDSSYGLQCLPLLLSTSNLTPTRFDAIVFNFGLHDIDYAKKYPEEVNDVKKYVRNLGRLKKNLMKTGASVSFVLTSPVTFDEELNKMVIKYNSAAKRVMRKKPAIDTVDLYQYVIDKCGQPPFDNCFMMKMPKDVHYGVAGSILLGKQVAAKFVEVLKARNLWVKKGYSLPTNANLSKPLFDLKADAVKCSQNATVPTRCPSRMTCVPNEISRTGFGCCPLNRGVDCRDNWHCCPQNTTCHKDCSFEWCKCLMT